MRLSLRLQLPGDLVQRTSKRFDPAAHGFHFVLVLPQLATSFTRLLGLPLLHCAFVLLELLVALLLLLLEGVLDTFELGLEFAVLAGGVGGVLVLGDDGVGLGGAGGTSLRVLSSSFS